MELVERAKAAVEWMKEEREQKKRLLALLQAELLELDAVDKELSSLGVGLPTLGGEGAPEMELRAEIAAAIRDRIASISELRLALGISEA